MATRKRRHATRRRKARASNPKRRRRSTALVHAARTIGHRRTHRRRRRRVGNPVTHHRRRVRRHRNPLGAGGGEAMEGVKVGIAAIGVTWFSARVIRPFVGGFLGGGPIAQAGITLASGYGLSYALGFVHFTRSWQKPVRIAAWAAAATQLVTSYVLPALSGGGAQPASMNGPAVLRRRRMNGIAAVPTLPPQLPMPVPQQQGQGRMNGIAAVPGRF